MIYEDGGILVHVNAPIVYVNAPLVYVNAPLVYVNAPLVYVNAPIVYVNAPPPTPTQPTHFGGSLWVVVFFLSFFLSGSCFCFCSVIKTTTPR